MRFFVECRVWVTGAAPSSGTESSSATTRLRLCCSFRRARQPRTSGARSITTCRACCWNLSSQHAPELRIYLGELAMQQYGSTGRRITLRVADSRCLSTLQCYSLCCASGTRLFDPGDCAFFVSDLVWDCNGSRIFFGQPHLIDDQLRLRGACPANGNQTPVGRHSQLRKCLCSPWFHTRRRRVTKDSTHEAL
jgi:hypothetical protein